MTECAAMRRIVPALIAFLAAPALAFAQTAEEERTDGQKLLVRTELPEGLHLVSHSPFWKGVTLRGSLLSGEADLDVPDGLDTESRGFSPPLVVRLQYDEKEISAFGAGVKLDFNTFQLSFDYYEGDWDGEGVLRVEDGVDPAVVTPVSLDGDFTGLKFAVYWPGARYRGRDFEMTLGIEGGAGWHHQELDPVPQSPLPLDDEVDELVGTIGPRLAVRVYAGQMEFSAEAAVLYLFGSSRGLSDEISLGIGIRF